MSALKWKYEGEWDITKRLFVTSQRNDSDPAKPVWTVSPSLDSTGWETDSDYPGYGLPREVAQRIVDLWNAALEGE